MALTYNQRFELRHDKYQLEKNMGKKILTVSVRSKDGIMYPAESTINLVNRLSLSEVIKEVAKTALVICLTNDLNFVMAEVRGVGIKVFGDGSITYQWLDEEDTMPMPLVSLDDDIEELTVLASNMTNSYELTEYIEGGPTTQSSGTSTATVAVPLFIAMGYLEVFT